MFFDISLFKDLAPPHALYKRIVAVKMTIDKQSPHAKLLKSGGFPGGVLPSKRLLGMCRWMWSHFHN